MLIRMKRDTGAHGMEGCEYELTPAGMQAILPGTPPRKVRTE